MTDDDISHDEPARRKPLVRWIPWIAGLVVVVLVFVIVRPSGDDDAGNTGSDSAAVETDTAGCTERQLTGSDYGPCKADAFTGDNGGATSDGVTADTIRVSFREANPAQLAALEAVAGDALASLGGDQAATTSDFESLVDYFNDQFELYGRTVELDVYEGQGEFLEEFQGKGVQGAQIDAARVRDEGSFADVSLATMTQPYAEALAAESVVLVGPVYMSQDWFNDRAPYAYGGPWATGTQMGEFAGNMTCAQLAGKPAEFAAGDLASTDRTFGVLHAENPEYSKIADSFEEALAECDETVERRLSYALDLASAQQDSVNAMAQMKDAGVTTVVCFCDEVYPIFFTPAADQQEYGPEWLAQWWPDPWGRLTSQDQWARSMHLGGATQPLDDTEIGTVMNAATNGIGPESPDSVALVYEQLLVLFSALQQAGPDLTPETFQTGMFSLPATDEGVFGPWQLGDGVYNPNTSFQLGWWSEDDPSGLDGLPGSVQGCGTGEWYRFDDADAMTSDGDAPACFG